jgi:TRAP-type C4-dicarboxylate transport system substrate-binding protein
MNKKGLLMLLCSIFFLFTFVPSTPAQTIRLSFADQNAEMGWGPTHALKPWVKNVEEATKGKVKIDVFHAQTLAKGPDIWNTVKSGIADIGWCFHGYWPDMTPLSDVITLPSLPIKSSEKASEVFWKLYEKFPEIQKEYKDVHVLTAYASAPYFLITSKKQVKRMEDLKGLKIRVVGGPPTQQMKALGAVPVLIPMPDTYLALDKGIIDGMGNAWEAIYAFKLYEILRYYTMVPLCASYFTVSMNKQKWESLPKDVQNAMTSVGGLEGAKFWGKNWYDTAEGAVVELIKKGNYQIDKYDVPPEEQARWTKVGGEPIWKEWVKKMEKRGYTDAQKILDITLELLRN